VKQAHQNETNIYLVHEPEEFELEDHGADDALVHSGIELSAVNEEAIPENADQGLTPADIIDLGNAGTWSIPQTPYRPSGERGERGEFHALLESAIGERAPIDSVTVSSAASPTELTLSDTSDLKVHDVIAVDVSDTGEDARFECTIITDIDTAVTVDPPLSRTPEDGADVHLGVQFRPGGIKDRLPVVSIHADRAMEHQAMAGLVTNQVQIEFPLDGMITIQASGEASGKRSFLGALELQDEAGPSDTTLRILPGHGRRVDVRGGPLYAQILDSEGEVEEVVRITGANPGAHADYDEITVDRAQKGTSAATHSAGAAVRPWRATPTRIGKELSHLGGKFVFGYEGRRYSADVRSCSFSTTQNQVLQAPYGSRYRTTRFRQGPNPRESTITPEIRMDAQSTELKGLAGKRIEVSGVVWAGDDPNGRMLAIGMPRVRLSFPTAPAGVGEVYTVNAQGRVLDVVRGANNEFRIAEI
jgi:hypothetical protein